MVFTGSRMDFDWSRLIWRENFVRSHLDERPWPRGASIRTQCQNPGNDHDRRPETPELNAFEMPESVSAEAPVPIRITVDNDYPPGAWERVVEALAVKLDVRLSIGVPHTFTNSGDSPCIVVASGARSILEACSKAAASPETTRGLVLISGLPAADTARPAVPCYWYAAGRVPASRTRLEFPPLKISHWAESWSSRGVATNLTPNSRMRSRHRSSGSPKTCPKPVGTESHRSIKYPPDSREYATDIWRVSRRRDASQARGGIVFSHGAQHPGRPSTNLQKSCAPAQLRGHLRLRINRGLVPATDHMTYRFQR